MKLKFTKIRRERLEKLATYLEGLPKGYKHFEMAVFFGRKDSDTDGRLEGKYALENGGVGHCGTNACAVGHGPSAGILFPKSMVKWVKRAWQAQPRMEVAWTRYAQLFTGDWTDQGDEHPASVAFEWMFGEDWHNEDNHHWGAAARIRYALAGKSVPTDRYDMVKSLYREFDKRYA